jgi:hypothetical protein
VLHFTEVAWKSYFWNSLIYLTDRRGYRGPNYRPYSCQNVLDTYIELGHDPATNQSLPDPPYEKKMHSIDYYSKKAQTWIVEDTCPEYMIKVTEELLKILFHSVRTSSDSLFHIGWGAYKKRRNELHIIYMLCWIKFNEGLSEAISYLSHFDHYMNHVSNQIKCSKVLWHWNYYTLLIAYRTHKKNC